MTTNAPTFDAINVSGNATIAGSLSLTNTGSALSVDGISTMKGALTVQGTQVIGSATNTSTLLRFLGATASNQDLAWYVDAIGAAGARFRQRLNTNQDMTFDCYDNSGASLGSVLTLRRLTQRGVFTKVVQAPSVNASQSTVTWPGPTGPYNPDQITFFSNTNTMTGVMPAGIYAPNYILINNDTADATHLDGAAGLRIAYGYGGAGTKGARQGLRVEIGQEGPHDQDLRVVGAYIINQVTQPTTINGTMWAINPYIIAKSGATGYGFINGMELDITIEAGASTVNRIGMTVNSSGPTDAVQGTNEDCAYSFRRNGNNSYPGWRVGFQVGGTGGPFPMDPAVGKIIYTMPMTGYSPSDPVTQYPAMVTDMGVDFFPTKFNTASFRYKGGLIDGSGSVVIGNATLSANTAGLAIDVNYKKVTAAVVVGGASGSRCFVNDLIWHDATGVVLRVTAVNGSNQATTVAIDTFGRSTTPPVNPVTFSGLNAAGVAVTLTWSVANTLALQPSAGTTTVGGPLLLVGDPTTALGAATKSYVDNTIAASTAGVSSFNTRTGIVILSGADIATAGGALVSSLPVASSTTPAMNGTAAVGNGTTWARADHVHPSDTSRLPLTGGTLTGATTVGTSTTSATFALNGPIRSQRRVQWNTASTMRWTLYTNSTDETGSDVGSDLDLIAASDAGGSKGVLMRMERATGNVKFDPSKAYPNGVLTSNLQIAANDGIILGVGQRTISGAPGGLNAILNSVTTINGKSDPRTGGWPVNSLIQFDNATVNGPVGTGNYRPFIFISTQSGVGSVGAGGALDVRSGDSASGGTGDRAAGQQYGTIAIRMTAVVNSNQGGTAANDTSGVAWGANIVCQAQNRATYLNAIRGIEVNVGVDTGASAQRMTGIKITQAGDNVTPFNGGEFIFMGRGASSTTNLSAAIKFAGYDAGWSWGNASILLDGSNYGNTYSSTIGQPLGYFADAWACDIQTAFARSPGPFGPMLLDGAAIQIGVTRIVPSATGVSIDTVGAYGTGTPTIAAAGTGYQVNDRLRYGNGGVVRVATLASGDVGGVGTVTVLRQPYLTTTSTPSNPLTTTTDYNSVGTGCTLNVTWNTTAKTLTLQPSGATTTMGGPLIVTGPLTFNTGPTIRAGTGAAFGTQPAGSIWLRTDGATGSRIYVSAGGGSWNAIAGV